MEVPWGETVDLDHLAKRLRATRYAALTIVHSETSTGALTDVRTATRLARETGAVAIVVGKAIYEGVFTVAEAVQRALGPIATG